MRSSVFFIFVIFTFTAVASDKLVIVAKPISVSLSDKSCNDYIDNDPNSIIQEVCIDRVFDISYQVLEVLLGNYESTIINGIDFYHYPGLPDHMIIDPACVTFRQDSGEYIHTETVPAIKKGGAGYVCKST